MSAMNYETPEAACAAYEEEWPDRIYFDEDERPMTCDECRRLLYFDTATDRFRHHTPQGCWLHFEPADDEWEEQ